MSRGLAAWLAGAEADRELVAWIGGYGDDWPKVFHECPRGDWLLVMAASGAVETRALVDGATACARLAKVYVPEAHVEDFDRALLDSTSWARGECSAASLLATAAMLDSLGAACDPAEAAALRAASATCYIAADRGRASHSATMAVEAAALAVGECAVPSAIAFMQRATADAVREQIAPESFGLPNAFA